MIYSHSFPVNHFLRIITDVVLSNLANLLYEPDCFRKAVLLSEKNSKEAVGTPTWMLLFTENVVYCSNLFEHNTNIGSP